MNRDRLTWWTYGSIGLYAYLLYGLGPVLSFLRRDLHLSYTVTSLHSTLFAAGSLVAAVSMPRLVARLGRRRLLASAVAAMAAGVLVLVVGEGFGLPATLPACVLAGFAGALTQITVVAVLSDHHSDHRDQAIVEANVVAVLCGVLAPLLLGASDRIGEWRLGLLPLVLAALALLPWLLRLTYPMAPVPVDATDVAAFSLRFWLLVVMVALVVAVEFCVVLWAAAFLASSLELPPARAAVATSVFVAGELLGRIVGSRLTRIPGRAASLFTGALLLTVVGFALFWLPRATPLNLVGLGVAGLGVANLYPLAFTLVIGAAGGRTDTASSRVGLSVSFAVLIAPFALGAAADWVGVATAFVVVPLLIAGALTMHLTAGRLAGTTRLAR